MFIKFEGMDKAIIGVTARDDAIVYDGHRILELLSENNGISREDALEFMEYNIIDLYVGEHTPVIVWLDTPEGVLDYASSQTEH
jgi:hypothetical protein